MDDIYAPIDYNKKKTYIKLNVIIFTIYIYNKFF